MMVQENVLIMLAHGSKDAKWKSGFEGLSQALQEKIRQHGDVHCAYLGYCEPSLLQLCEKLSQQNVKRITILPMFIGTGTHVSQEIPLLLDEVRTKFSTISFQSMPIVSEMDTFSAWLAQQYEKMC